LKSAAGRVVSAGIDDQRIVHPFADFVRQSGDVLGEVARVVDIREHRVGLRSAGKSKRAVIATDAAKAVLGEIRVINHEDGKRVGLDGRSVLHDSLNLRVKIIDVYFGGSVSKGRSCGPAALGN